MRFQFSRWFLSAALGLNLLAQTILVETPPMSHRGEASLTSLFKNQALSLEPALIKPSRRVFSTLFFCFAIVTAQTPEMSLKQMLDDLEKENDVLKAFLKINKKSMKAHVPELKNYHEGLAQKLENVRQRYREGVRVHYVKPKVASDPEEMEKLQKQVSVELGTVQALEYRYKDLRDSAIETLEKAKSYLKPGYKPSSKPAPRTVIPEIASEEMMELRADFQVLKETSLTIWNIRQSIIGITTQPNALSPSGNSRLARLYGDEKIYVRQAAEVIKTLLRHITKDQIKSWSKREKIPIFWDGIDVILTSPPKKRSQKNGIAFPGMSFLTWRAG